MKMPEKQAILLDSCFVNNIFSKEKDLAAETFKLLEKLAPDKGKFYVSEFTYYELLKGAATTKREKKECFVINYKRQRGNKACQFIYLLEANLEALRENT